MLDWLKEKGRRFLTHEDGREFFRKMKEETLEPVLKRRKGYDKVS
ncbi:hypothetical protein [Wolbachia endosymbiont (group A) of Myopa testacea]